jgi:para-nitrobenzyl esterase
MSSGMDAAGDEGAHWLTLNVWSPDLGAAGLPVLVWIHGGRYMVGGTDNPHQDGTVLAKAGVVFVSLNYRVGVEGFARIGGCPNNRGVLDQIAALRWVQDNVVAFGGDPCNVTVFGESAGAGSVAALLAMPIAAGLFHRAIAHSVPGTFFTERLASAISTEIAAEFGMRATREQLETVSPFALAVASQAVLKRMPKFADTWGPMALTPTPFSPVVDGAELPHAPWRALAGGAARGVDLLVGHTRDEYSLFNNWRDKHMTNDQLTTTLQRLVPNAYGPNGYRAAYPDASSAELYELVNADWLFRIPSQQLAEAQSAGQAAAWLFELCWSFNQDERASHGLGALLVFGTLGINDVTNHRSAHPNAHSELARISAAMRTECVNFASHGDPGWPRYDPRARLTRVYNAEPSTEPYPEEPSRRLWADNRFDTLDLIGRPPQSPR